MAPAILLFFTRCCCKSESYLRSVVAAQLSSARAAQGTRITTDEASRLAESEVLAQDADRRGLFASPAPEHNTASHSRGTRALARSHRREEADGSCTTTMYPAPQRHNPLLGPGPVPPAAMPMDAAAAQARRAHSAICPTSGGPAFCVDPAAPITHTQCVCSRENCRARIGLERNDCVEMRPGMHGRGLQRAGLA